MDIKERISKLVDNALADDCCFNCSDCKQYHNSCVDCTTDKILALFEPVTPEWECPGTAKCPEIYALGELNFIDETAWNIAVNEYCDKCQERNNTTQLYRVRE